MTTNNLQALTEESFDLAIEIAKKFKVTNAEALLVATSIHRNAIEAQRNRVFDNAFVATGSGPSALEAIAIQMGYKPGFSQTIVDAISSLKED